MDESYDKLLDSIGRKILSELQFNGRLPFAELGRRVGLSTPSVMDRVHRLEEAGIIESYKAVINPARLGYSMLAFVGVNVAGDVMTRFTKQVLGIPAVIECHRVTGEHSFLLKVLVSSVEELEQVIDMLTPYTHTTTYLVLSTAFSTRNLDPKQGARMKGIGKAKQSRVESGP